MPRIPLAKRADITDEVVLDRWQATFGDKDPATDDSMIGPNGTRGDYWAAIANSPNTVRHVWDQFAYLKGQKLSKIYREIGLTRAGYLVGSRFVFSQHCKGLRANGWSEEKISHVPNWQTADCYDETERLLFLLADQLVLERGRVNDDTFAELRKHLSDEEIVEFIHGTLIYQLHATVCRALRVEFDDVDERVQEVGIGAYTLGQ
jgi:alkylhydroperoxidase family enzyme